MKVKFEFEKATKNCIRFQEKLEKITDAPQIGTLYVQKNTLKELGYEEGNGIEIEISVIK